jgi:hypothetical protein
VRRHTVFAATRARTGCRAGPRASATRSRARRYTRSRAEARAGERCRGSALQQRSLSRRTYRLCLAARPAVRAPPPGRSARPTAQGTAPGAHQNHQKGGGAPSRWCPGWVVAHADFLSEVRVQPAPLWIGRDARRRPNARKTTGATDRSTRQTRFMQPCPPCPHPFTCSFSHRMAPRRFLVRKSLGGCPSSD